MSEPTRIGDMIDDRYGESVDVTKHCRRCKQTFIGVYWKKPAEDAQKKGHKILGICAKCADIEDKEAKEREKKEKKRRIAESKAYEELPLPTTEDIPRRDWGL